MTMVNLSTQRLSTIEIFCKAAELSSFARTAEVLGLNPSAVSKAVSRLERRLAIKLFHRTTRKLRLTEEGSLYFERCHQALGIGDKLRSSIVCQEGSFEGRCDRVKLRLDKSLS